MFKLITILILAVNIQVVYTQPWIEQTSNVTVQLTSVSDIDNNNSWICSYNGTVLRTTNGGQNWNNVSGNGIPGTIQLINVFGIDLNRALVCGYIGSDTWVYRTSNAGANWTQVFTQAGGFINAIWIKLDSTGFMTGDPVGGRWSLWKTTNNGVNWDSSGLYLPQAGSETGFNNCMSFSQNRIWFGTNNSRLYYSTNNGTNWSVQSISEPSITSVWFDLNGSPTGYCGGNSVWRTTNYGVNWTNTGGAGTGLILGVAGLGMWSGNIWYVRNGSPSIYFGYGGPPWNIQYTAPAGNYRHITTNRIFNFPFRGYAVRTNGGVSQTTIFVEGINNLGGAIPTSFSLSQNYPNPFNPSSKIKMQIAKLSAVKLIAFDILGREVKTLVNEQLQPGTYEVGFDWTDLPSGVYYYKLSAGDFVETKKMVLIK